MNHLRVLNSQLNLSSLKMTYKCLTMLILLVLKLSPSPSGWSGFPGAGHSFRISGRAVHAALLEQGPLHLRRLEDAGGDVSMNNQGLALKMFLAYFIPALGTL